MITTMTKGWLAASILLGGLASGAAQAGPVLAGSSYSVYIEGESSDAALDMTNSYDGVAQTFLRSGNTLTVNDAETDLGGGFHRIVVSVNSTGDLFPFPDEAGFAGIGIDGNGFDLVGNRYLQDAYLHYYVNGTDVFTSSDLADDFRFFFPGAWNGRFADTGVAFQINNLGGAGVNGYALEFVVSELNTTVPEPGSLALAASALLAMAAARRRKR
jgi:hypothetical protein